ncbi:MAG: hypothetical protein ACFKPT_31305 [Gloeotrichia echinulata GP01]
MLNRYLLPSSVVSAAIVFIASPVLALETLPSNQIAQIARETVVRIEASNGVAGSGVIINRETKGGKNIYVVLTAKQIVQNKTQQYNIITPVFDESGKRQKIQISPDGDIEEIPDTDLVQLRFRSDRNYKTANTNANPTKCAGVYVSGFAKSLINRKRVFQFISVFDEKANDMGMIGAPIFDVSGQIVSVNGSQEEAANNSNESADDCKCPPGTRGFGNKRKFGRLLRSFLQRLDINQNNGADSPKPTYRSPFSEGIASGSVRGSEICINPYIDIVEPTNIEVEK